MRCSIRRVVVLSALLIAALLLREGRGGAADSGLEGGGHRTVTFFVA